jgi:hypothetical protein
MDTALSKMPSRMRRYSLILCVSRRFNGAKGDVIRADDPLGGQRQWQVILRVGEGSVFG